MKSSAEKVNVMIEKWFNAQHYLPVMLRSDWRDTLLKEEVYTKDTILELMQTFYESIMTHQEIG